MKRMVQPVPPDDEALDALLGAYFKAEVPTTWPAFQPPRRAVLPFRPAAAPPRRLPFGLSRLALVASVALLLLAAWLMPRGPLSAPGAPDALRTGSGSASTRPDLGEPVLPKELFKEADQATPDKVKSSLRLEQKDGQGSIRIDVEELPPGR